MTREVTFSSFHVELRDDTVGEIAPANRSRSPKRELNELTNLIRKTRQSPMYRSRVQQTPKEMLSSSNMQSENNALGANFIKLLKKVDSIALSDQDHFSVISQELEMRSRDYKSL